MHLYLPVIFFKLMQLFIRIKLCGFCIPVSLLKNVMNMGMHIVLTHVESARVFSFFVVSLNFVG